MLLLSINVKAKFLVLKSIKEFEKLLTLFCISQNNNYIKILSLHINTLTLRTYSKGGA